jgi:uncharacterized protein with HEPN domain
MRLNDDPTRLNHVLDASKEAIGYVDSIDRTQFAGDRLRQHAVVRCIEIVGEAAARLTKEIRDDNQHIPWADIISMRNRIVHAYFDIDIDLIWKTATEDLPGLLPEIYAIRETLENSE